MRSALLVLPLVLAVANAAERRDGVDNVTSAAGSLASDVTDAVHDVFTKVTDIGGDAVTLISVAGGAVFTLASDGAGSVTSIAGHAYTIATSAAGAAATAASSVVHSNEARPLQPWSISVPLVSSLAAIVGGVAAGAWVAL